MTSEERVASLHERMDTMRRIRERRITRVIGTAGILAAVCLILLIINGGTAHMGGTADMYSGAIMLFEGVGGYILLAILAFMAGVVITVILMKRKGKQEQGSHEGSTAEADTGLGDRCTTGQIHISYEKRPAENNTECDIRHAAVRDRSPRAETTAEAIPAHKKDNMIKEGGCDEKKD